jgi:hypothetical protein
MSKPLKDLRDSLKTIDDADREFENLAMLEIDIAKIEASCEKRIAEVKAEYARTLDGFTVMRDSSVKRLASFVDANRSLFQKPRRRKTQWGTYGLTDASKAQIDNKDDAIKSCIEQGWKDCIKTTLTLLSKPLRDRLIAGENCTGARLVSGDVAGYTIKKELIDKAKEI